MWSIHQALKTGKNLSRDELIQIMVAHPKIIEHPIVMNDLTAAIARPLELILPITT